MTTFCLENPGYTLIALYMTLTAIERTTKCIVLCFKNNRSVAKVNEKIEEIDEEIKALDEENKVLDKKNKAIDEKNKAITK